jgi:hypothetical protein
MSEQQEAPPAINIELMKLTVEQAIAANQSNTSVIKEYASQAIRGAFVLNGSAAIAVLAKQGSLNQSGGEIIWYCAAGALCAVLCAGVSYLAQTIYSVCSTKVFAEILKSLQTGTPVAMPSLFWGHVFTGLSWALFAGSLGVFGFALTKAIPFLENTIKICV